MLGPRTERDIGRFDPFTISEYENIIRIIHIYARENPGLVTLKDGSFTLNDDIVIEDPVSVSGALTHSYDIRKSTAKLTIRKDSFYISDPEPASRISMETVCNFLAERESDDESSDIPEILNCSLVTNTTFVEKSESTLLSKKKSFVEKTYSHTLTATEFVEDTDPALVPDDAKKIYKKEGYCKINAATGYVIEEKH